MQLIGDERQALIFTGGLESRWGLQGLWGHLGGTAIGTAGSFSSDLNLGLIRLDLHG